MPFVPQIMILFFFTSLSAEDSLRLYNPPYLPQWYDESILGDGRTAQLDLEDGPLSTLFGCPLVR